MKELLTGIVGKIIRVSYICMLRRIWITTIGILCFVTVKRVLNLKKLSD